MTTFTFNYLNNYKNHGQNAEQSIRFRLTDEIIKADNLPHTAGADCFSFQVKGARATICKGADLKAYLDFDASDAYIYATKSGIAYVMDRAEYEEFCNTFATATRDSAKNGGALKLRLRYETQTMLDWLRERI